MFCAPMLRIEMAGYGPPSVLEPVERPDPIPGRGEVTLRVALAGVNRADCFIRSGEWQQAGPFPYVPGLEACGVVERVGPGVSEFAPGDRVITMMQRLGGIHGERPGGYQEIVTVPARSLARVPAALDLDTAAELGLPAVTALLALETLEVRPAHRVLVQGAASAVGQMAVQMIRGLGAIPIGTTQNPAKLPLLRELGAELAVSTRDPDWPQQIPEIDRVFDLVGRATFAASVDRLGPGGRLVFVGGTSGGDLAFSGWALMRPVTLTGYSSEALTAPELARAMSSIADLSTRGALRVPNVRRHPLRQAAMAHTELESGHSGRVVLDPRLPHPPADPA
jgi:NADPH2:quinone reductase